MNSLCKYKFIFGKPNKGIHAHRLLGFAIADVIATILGGIFIGILYNYYINKKIELNNKYISYSIICAFIVGIIMHKLFCVDTKLNLLIGL